MNAKDKLASLQVATSNLFEVGSWIDSKGHLQTCVKIQGARNGLSVETALKIARNIDAFADAILAANAAKTDPKVKADALRRAEESKVGGHKPTTSNRLEKLRDL